MINVTVLIQEDTPISSFGLPIDILNAAGVLWNSIAGIPPKPLFRVSTVTPDGEPVKCFHSVTITPDASLHTLNPPDVLIVSAVGRLSGITEKYQATLKKVEELHYNGSILASICSGAFLLAATGLLDGKKATTHWGMTSRFAKLFPKVRLRPDQIVVDEGSLLTSGGATAGADLALYLIRRFYGQQEADRTARVLLLEPFRRSQAPFEILTITKDHGDAEVSRAQEWIAANYNRETTIDQLASLCSLSRRTFERRFKKATGLSPLRYLRKIRIEMAKHLLESGNQTFENITLKVGYEDTSTFRRVFQKSTGLPPSVYRQKFQREQKIL